MARATHPAATARLRPPRNAAARTSPRAAAAVVTSHGATTASPPATSATPARTAQSTGWGGVSGVTIAAVSDGPAAEAVPRVRCAHFRPFRRRERPVRDRRLLARDAAPYPSVRPALLETRSSAYALRGRADDPALHPLPSLRAAPRPGARFLPEHREADAKQELPAPLGPDGRTAHEESGPASSRRAVARPPARQDHRRQVPRSRHPGRGGNGHGLRGGAHRAGPLGRSQGAPRGAGEEEGLGPALPARSPRRGGHRAPQHLRRDRPGHARRRQPVHRHGASRGRDARRPGRRRGAGFRSTT